MIRLNQTATQLISLITAQNGANVVVSYSDKTATAYSGDTQVTNITSATTTTIASTPAASTIRDVDHINIRNTYAGSQAVTVQLSSSATLYPLISATLAQSEVLEYTHAAGWKCLDANGNIKTTPVPTTSAALAGIITDETGSGALAFATSPTLTTPKATTTIGVGNATAAASGAGISFPATQSASTDANTLDDYEEGTWTPTILGSSTAGTTTYVAQLGSYVKIGKTVYVKCYVQWSAQDGTGNLLVGGAPFTSANDGFEAGMDISYISNLALTAANVAIINKGANSTNFNILQTPTGGGTLSAVPVDAAAAIGFSGTYIV